MRKPELSAHAILRWMERVVGIPVPEYRRDMAAIDECSPEKVSDWGLADWIMAEKGWDLDYVEGVLLTPIVLAAFSAGARKVKDNNVTLCFNGPCVATIVSGNMKALPGGRNRQSKNKRRKRRCISK